MRRKMYVTSMPVVSCIVIFVILCVTPVRPAPGQPLATPEPLNVKLSVKETAGVGATKYPITVVVPLEEGRYQDTNSFRVVNLVGMTVPAQFEGLTRWWGTDYSLRHIAVHFQPTVSAFIGKGSGIAEYYLRDDGQGNYAPSPITLTETSSEITVNTGVLQFVVKKDHFNILDQVWLDKNNNQVFESHEKMISSSPFTGGVLVPRQENTTGPQYDASRPDVKVELEERGPLRVVIRAAALTHYNSTTDHTHGWAVRIYAYAGKPYLKIDYQLQNSAKNVVYAWPLYFEAMAMNFRLNLDDNPTVKFGTGVGYVYERARDDGIYLAQKMHDRFEIVDANDHTTLHAGTIPEGFISVHDGQQGVTAIIRNFWQMWPNGLKVDRSNTLSIQLFPEWSAQWPYNQDQDPYGLNPTGLYWLEDMQHVYKETLLWFHSASVSNAELRGLAKTFQYHPVAVIPPAHYRQTKATLDLGGVLPEESSLNTSPEDLRVPSYGAAAYDPSSDQYQFNWDSFKVDLARKIATSQPGGWPYGNAKFIATGNPADYFNAEDFAMGELNVRPQWLAEYTHTNDWSFLQLSENPYGGGIWRKFEGHNVAPWAAPYLDKTGRTARARDDEHGWFYHVEEAYYLTGNPWIREWYEFIAEFRQVVLQRLDPYPNPSSRAMGHGSAHAIQAYRITGNKHILPSFQDFITELRANKQDPLYGCKDTDATFQVGFLSRSIIGFMEEVRGKDWQAYAEAFQLLSGFMVWNRHYSHFSYYINASQGEIGQSDGSGLTMVDPQMWYYWNTGKEEFFDHVEQYMRSGLNGGGGPYGNFQQWGGQYEGRAYLFAHNTRRDDTTPPAPITDLNVVRTGAEVVLTWTAPPDQDLERYHIVWSDKPIAATQTTDSSKSNWWAANVVGPALVPQPGAPQTLTLPAIPAGPVYVAMFTFDQQQNMSEISQKALTVTTTGPGTVRSAPGGIDCGRECRAAFNEDTVVTLTAIPDIGSTFAGWAGACHGPGECRVTMNEAKEVTATFEGPIGEVLISKEQELRFDRGGDRTLPFVSRGDVISYTITATNRFNVAVTLMISDALSAFVDYVAGTLKINGELISDFYFSKKGLLRYESAPINENELLRITFNVIVKDDVPYDALIENSGMVSAYPVGSGTLIKVFSQKMSNVVRSQVKGPVP